MKTLFILIDTFSILSDLLSRLKYAIIKFRGVNDKGKGDGVTVRAYTINRRTAKKKDRDRRTGRELINEKGVTWRCAAHQPRALPHFISAFTLSYVALFGFSFCSLFFFSLCFVIPMLHLLCQRRLPSSPQSPSVSSLSFVRRSA